MFSKSLQSPVTLTFLPQLYAASMQPPQWIILMHGIFSYRYPSLSQRRTHTHTESEKVLAMQRVWGRAAAFGSNAERAQLAHDWPSAGTDPDSLLRTNPCNKHTPRHRDNTTRQICTQRGTTIEENLQGQRTNSDAPEGMKAWTFALEERNYCTIKF